MKLEKDQENELDPMLMESDDEFFWDKEGNNNEKLIRIKF